MRRYLFETWEEIQYLLELRWKYLRIKKRYLFRRNNDKFRFDIFRKTLFWILLIAVIIILILIGYKFPSLGFSSYVLSTGEIEREKTLWDWLQLLITPVMLSLLAYYLTNIQKDKELAIAQIEKSADALQNYLDYMTKLLVEQDYADGEKFDGTARLMRARTLMVLELLNGKQKGHLLRFLIEAGLLDIEEPYLDMKRAHLVGTMLEPGLYNDFALNHVNLDKANFEYCRFQNIQMNSISMQRALLEGINLEGASLEYILLKHSDLYNAKLSNAKIYKADIQDVNLESADLKETILERSSLRGANLRECIARKASLMSCDLSFANLIDADFEDADLSRVNFYRTNLKNTNLRNANLAESNITEAQLRKVKSFEGAKLPSNIKLKKLKRK